MFGGGNGFVAVVGNSLGMEIWMIVAIVVVVCGWVAWSLAAISATADKREAEAWVRLWQCTANRPPGSETTDEPDKRQNGGRDA